MRDDVRSRLMLSTLASADRFGVSADAQTSPARIRRSGCWHAPGSRSAASVSAVVASSPDPAQGDEVSTRMSNHRSRHSSRIRAPWPNLPPCASGNPPAIWRPPTVCTRRWGGPCSRHRKRHGGATPDLPAAPDATTRSELQVEGQLDLGLGRRRHVASDHLSACALELTGATGDRQREVQRPVDDRALGGDLSPRGGLRSWGTGPRPCPRWPWTRTCRPHRPDPLARRSAAGCPRTRPRHQG
jgi:hypothetical protein